MNYNTQLGIIINFLKIGDMANTGVLQVGTAGNIKRYSRLHGYSIHPKVPSTQYAPSVPLQSPVREK